MAKGNSYSYIWRPTNDGSHGIQNMFHIFLKLFALSSSKRMCRTAAGATSSLIDKAVQLLWLCSLAKAIKAHTSMHALHMSRINVE